MRFSEVFDTDDGLLLISNATFASLDYDLTLRGAWRLEVPGYSLRIRKALRCFNGTIVVGIAVNGSGRKYPFVLLLGSKK